MGVFGVKCWIFSAYEMVITIISSLQCELSSILSFMMNVCFCAVIILYNYPITHIMILSHWCVLSIVWKKNDYPSFLLSCHRDSWYLLFWHEYPSWWTSRIHWASLFGFGFIKRQTVQQCWNEAQVTHLFMLTADQPFYGVWMVKHESCISLCSQHAHIDLQGTMCEKRKVLGRKSFCILSRWLRVGRCCESFVRAVGGGLFLLLVSTHNNTFKCCCTQQLVFIGHICGWL